MGNLSYSAATNNNGNLIEFKSLAKSHRGYIVLDKYNKSIFIKNYSIKGYKPIYLHQNKDGFYTDEKSKIPTYLVGLINAAINYLDIIS